MTMAAGEREATSYSSKPLIQASSRRPRLDVGKEWVLFILFMLPNALLFGFFTFWPMIENIRLSTQRWNLLSRTRRNVGLDNFKFLLEDETFRKVLFNTFYFTAAAVGLSLLIGLIAALLLNQPLKFRDGARAVVFAPTLLSGAAIGIVWSYIFDPNYGLIAQGLSWVGLHSPDWLNRPEWSMPAIIIVYVWKNLGFATVIFLAGLQAIPRDLYDAAKVDGANMMWRFRSVTLPMLSPISFFLLITSILNTFQAFDIIRVMTQGGPTDSTNTLIYYVYEQAFDRGMAGRSAAAALVMFVLMMGITLVQLRFTERRVHYG